MAGIINVSSIPTPNPISAAGTCTSATVPVTSTSAIMLAANANRKRALILNLPTATTTVYLSFGATADITKSLPLAPGQGWLEDSSIVHLGAFSAITISGTGSLSCFDWA